MRHVGTNKINLPCKTVCYCLFRFQRLIIFHKCIVLLQKTVINPPGSDGLLLSWMDALLGASKLYLLKLQRQEMYYWLDEERKVMYTSNGMRVTKLWGEFQWTILWKRFSNASLFEQQVVPLKTQAFGWFNMAVFGHEKCGKYHSPAMFTLLGEVTLLFSYLLSHR